MVAATALCVLERDLGKPSTTNASVNMTMALAIVSLCAVNIGLVSAANATHRGPRPCSPTSAVVAVDKLLLLSRQRKVGAPKAHS